MKKLTLAVGLLALSGTTAMAQQTTQSRPTSQAGVRGSTFTSGMTSSNSGAMTSSGMRDSTTGLNAGSGPERGGPEGSPARAEGDNRPERPAIKQRDAAQVSGCPSSFHPRRRGGQGTRRILRREG